jgi:hypothetical protein
LRRELMEEIPLFFHFLLKSFKNPKKIEALLCLFDCFLASTYQA